MLARMTTQKWLGLLCGGAVLLMAQGCGHTRVVKMYTGPIPTQGVSIITAPDHVEILMLDGRRVPGLNFAPGKDTLAIQVPAGGHDIKVRYHEIWPTTADRHEVVVSEMMALPLETEAGVRYHLEMTRPKTLEEAKTFAVHPRIRVTRESRAVMTDIQGLDQPGVAASNPWMTSPMPETSVPAKTSPVVEEIPAVSPPPAGAVMGALRQIWSLASPEDRRQFLKWVEKSGGPQR